MTDNLITMTDALELALPRAIHLAQSVEAKPRTVSLNADDLSAPLPTNQIVSPTGEVWEVLDDPDFDWTSFDPAAERAAADAFFGAAK